MAEIEVQGLPEPVQIAGEFPTPAEELAIISALRRQGATPLQQSQAKGRQFAQPALGTADPRQVLAQLAQPTRTVPQPDPQLLQAQRAAIEGLSPKV